MANQEEYYEDCYDEDYDWLLNQIIVQQDNNCTLPIKPHNIESWLTICKLLQEHFINLQKLPEYDSVWAHGEEMKTSKFVKFLIKTKKGYNR